MDLLSGNQAIARGAWEAGVTIAAAYPGTPSTETLETLAPMDGVYAEWCINEKVAVEVALGASAAGARVLTAMKHVGVNVAADPLFTAAYTGVGGGMVILAADDPGMYSSQDEQDSHYYALAAHIPMLDPADSQEAYSFTKIAYDLSEEFDVPFFIRSSVRISHTKTPVSTGKRNLVSRKQYETNPSKWVMMPAYAKPRRKVQLKRIETLKSWVEESNLNRIETGDSSVGIICYGSAYQHVKEAMPEANIFKLGISWPLPANKLNSFASECDKVYVVEEGSTYLSEAVSSCGVSLSDFPEELPLDGELTPRLIAQAFNKEIPDYFDSMCNLPGRPPALCPGCPHRLVFKELSRLKAIVTGDIGCYTLGALPPLRAMDTTIDMGASVSMSHGFELALADTDHRPVVAVIGDSTFAHSGLSSLISTVYNNGRGTICILDNRTTAMTGRQGNPFNGVTLQHRPTHELDLEGVIKAIGVKDVQVIDPNDMKAVRGSLKAATLSEDLSVLIFRSPCILLSRERHKPYYVNSSCTACGVCVSLGCPAIAKDSYTGIASIDTDMCIGCGQCAQYCAFKAIEN